MHWLQRKEPELISKDNLKKGDLTVKKVHKITLLTVFLIFSKMVHKKIMVSVELNSVDHDTYISIKTTYNFFFTFKKNH